MFVRLLRCALKKKRIKSHPIDRCYHKDHSDLVTNVSLVGIRQTLRQKSIAFMEGHTCINVDCPICEIDKRAKSPKIYINKTTGFFMCDKCKSVGSWNILEKLLSLKMSSKTLAEFEKLKKNLLVEKDYTDVWTNMKKHCLDVSKLSKDTYEKIVNMLSLKNMSQEDISMLNCLYDEGKNVLYFPLYAFGHYLVGFKHLSLNTRSELTVPTSDVSGLIVYKQKNTRSDSTAIVVPTIPDLLALISQKSMNLIICLPYNLQYLPQQVLPSLENFKKLILWFGNDDSSWDTARHFAKKLNEERCYFVRPTDVQPRPKVAIDLGYDVRNIIQNAQPIWHKSITTFRYLRNDVLSDLQNIDKVQGIKWKRYPTLNRILKGHRRGEFTILTGPTGCGKTTFMSEYSLDLALQGVNTLWGSFEIRNARLAKTMLQQMAGVSLDDNLVDFDMYADAFEKLPIYFMTFHGQQNIKVVMDAVEHATYVHDISHVIIDNVQFMMGTSDESKHVDRFWRQDRIIAAFRTFATKYNCHVTLVIHPRKERDDEELTTSSIFGSAKASQEADNVLIIQDKRLTSIRGKKYLQVAKNRYSGDLGVMPLDFDKSSLSYATKKKLKSETKSSTKDDLNKESISRSTDLSQSNEQ
ncbi:hypothetical protein KPH14_012133 [Odynerus spinipes]|uniref:DNA 5'-3' helicase n=1 Tax=Odynerus spinipes TaxID=1348599 RepID=A0AAD9VL03_9HYME|nr:hypothetical protein KPH14_012133 [Odynerus spinipes]